MARPTHTPITRANDPSRLQEGASVRAHGIHAPAANASEVDRPTYTLSRPSAYGAIGRYSVPALIFIAILCFILY